MAPSPWSQGDSYWPSYGGNGPPPPPPDGPTDVFRFRGNANDQKRRSRGRPRDHRHDPKNNFSFRAAHRISERPLLRQRDNQVEERVLGNHGSQDRFRDVENLTDSDEAEMEDSDDETRLHVKRVKYDVVEDQKSQTPKWSNPDPYTSLPAPNETTGKKVDFVKLIRKARQDLQKVKTDASVTVDDFISLKTNDKDNVVRDNSSTLQHQLPRRQGELSTDYQHGSGTETNAHKNLEDDGNALGKRKRGQERGTKSLVKLVKVRGQEVYYSNAEVLPKWKAVDGESAAPWLRTSKEVTGGIALHKEILDFYEWVKPQEYEFAVRADCISRLAAALRRHQPGELKAFGSYGAGLFLPTGDMDLVFLDGPFLARLRRGERSLNAPISRFSFRNWLHFIRNANIAKPGSIVPIAGAKVPIIKFVDRISGLKIDLSFNNDTGLVAIETFQKWKTAFPAMPILVSVVKQFLMIRGLNDVSTGGLGGFSIICLVTSLLQHLPSFGGPQNLGTVLLEFFNLYGNHLDRDMVAIRLDPPGYIDKEKYSPHLFNQDKKGRLTIIDPHRPENNISGGTKEIQLIADVFSAKYDVLLERLAEYENREHNLSLLAPIIGGNFEEYLLQRDALYSLHCGKPGSHAPSTAPVPDESPLLTSGPEPPAAEATVAYTGYVRAVIPTEEGEIVSSSPPPDSGKSSSDASGAHMVHLRAFSPTEEDGEAAEDGQRGHHREKTSSNNSPKKRRKSTRVERTAKHFKS